MCEIQFEYGPADTEALGRIWDQNIAAHPGDERWVYWKKLLMMENANGRVLTFLVTADGRPIGEGTLVFDTEYEEIGGHRALAERGKTANVNGLRVEKAFEGQGHISRLVRRMEDYARETGCRKITIGVDESEQRNRAIYAHWGYTEFLFSEMENGENVLYYAKTL